MKYRLFAYYFLIVNRSAECGLEERLRKNRHQIECDISYEMIDVRDLIDDAIGSIVNSILDRPSEIYVHGDWVEGDKIGNDKIEGDKIKK